MLRPALDGRNALFYIVFVCENAFFSGNLKHLHFTFHYVAWFYWILALNISLLT